MINEHSGSGQALGDRRAQAVSQTTAIPPNPEMTLAEAAAAVRVRLFQLAGDLEALGTRVTGHSVAPVSAAKDNDVGLDRDPAVAEDVAASMSIIDTLRHMVDRMTKLIG